MNAFEVGVADGLEKTAAGRPMSYLKLTDDARLGSIMGAGFTKKKRVRKWDRSFDPSSPFARGAVIPVIS